MESGFVAVLKATKHLSTGHSSSCCVQECNCCVKACDCCVQYVRPTMMVGTAKSAVRGTTDSSVERASCGSRFSEMFQAGVRRLASRG